MRRGWLGSVLAVSLLLFAPAAHAEEPKNKGLFVTPVREYVNVAPGHTQQKQLTIANITDTPVVVDLSVEQFSVADYTYDFTFSPIKDNWVTLATPRTELQPDKSQAIAYTIAPPANATPGGHYFSIFATATVQNGSVKSQVRTATTVYVTVQGALQVSSAVQKAAIPRISFGGDIPFSIDVKNTGNTHFFVYASGRLQGLTAKGPGAETTHLLLPGTIRTTGGTIPPPTLPGIYAATYGYKTDGGETKWLTSHVVYLPLWSLLIPAGIVLAIFAIRHRHKKRLKLTDF